MSSELKHIPFVHTIATETGVYHITAVYPMLHSKFIVVANGEIFDFNGSPDLLYKTPKELLEKFIIQHDGKDAGALRN